MSTRSHIGKQLEDGSIKYIYCHFDGYEAGVGVTLKEHYTDEAKVDELLELGDLSYLRPEIGEKQDFDDRSTHNDNWCLAYGRDRREKNTKAKTTTDTSEFTYQGHAYLFVSGEWKTFR
jgi:hypothetical protein